MLTDPDGGAASCRVYNEWIADGLARSPRFKCAGWYRAGVDDAVAEVERIAEAGLGSVMVPAVATPDWNHRTWAPMWSAIAASGLPAVVHQGTGHSMYFYRGPGAGVANLLATQSMAPRMAGLLATSGVLAANPRPARGVRRVQRRLAGMGDAHPRLLPAGVHRGRVHRRGEEVGQRGTPGAAQPVPAAPGPLPPSRMTRSVSTTSPTPARRL